MDGRMVGNGDQPVICTPLVGRTQTEIFNELDCVVPQKPDIIEWRADYFSHVFNTEQVVEVAQAIKQKAGAIPVIFTVRSVREGGQPITLDETAVVELSATICRYTDIEYVDFELSNQTEHISFLRDIAHTHGKKVIASFHEFRFTPARDALLEKFLDAERYGLDVAKVAVMPNGLEDVLTLLSCSLEAKKVLTIPHIAISLGSNGLVTRLVGGIFGSSASFAIGHSSSAPGQVPIEDLRTVLRIIGKMMPRQ